MLTNIATAARAGNSALGTAGEMRLIAGLLERGHKVAIPVVDDDGVDLVVDYSLRVQVKTSANRNLNNSLQITLHHASPTATAHPLKWKRRPGVRDHVDVLAAYARDTDEWWFIPGGAVPRDVPAIHLRRPLARKSKYAYLAQYHEAWGVFDGVIVGDARCAA